eukprot:Transcript_4112.p1 GENE.Transcript_4112~~Transcript_4112.p1  ORF type:complete len:590 (+),score=238.18 Transcript_4112:99-1772(+)
MAGTRFLTLLVAADLCSALLLQPPLASRPACADATLRALPLRASASEPLDVGASFPPSVLQKLGVSGSKAVVCFILEDRGFACGKQLRTLAERSESFAARGCRVVAVRPPAGVAPGIDDQYRSIGFVEDTNDGLRQQLGLSGGDGSGGGGFFGGGSRMKRATYVLAANGTVAGVVSDRVDSTEHAVQALRTLAALEAAEAATAPPQPWAFSLFEPQSQLWRAPYDAEIDRITATLKAARAARDTGAEAAAQAALTETWAKLGQAKAAAFEAEKLVDEVARAERRIPPLVEVAELQEAKAAAALSKAAGLREIATETLAAVRAANARLLAVQADAAPESAEAAAQAARAAEAAANAAEAAAEARREAEEEAKARATKAAAIGKGKLSAEAFAAAAAETLGPDTKACAAGAPQATPATPEKVKTRSGEDLERLIAANEAREAAEAAAAAGAAGAGGAEAQETAVDAGLDALEAKLAALQNLATEQPPPPEPPEEVATAVDAGLDALEAKVAALAAAAAAKAPEPPAEEAGGVDQKLAALEAKMAELQREPPKPAADGEQ